MEIASKVWTKEKKEAYIKEYRITHKAELSEYTKKYNRDHKDARDRWNQSHKPELAAKSRRYRQGHPERVKAVRDAYYQTHRAEEREKAKEYNRTHTVEQVIYRKTHTAERAVWNKKRNMEIKIEVLSHYGKDGKPVCVKCGYNENINGLQLDHINGDGGEHRRKLGKYSLHLWAKKNHYPNGLQTLCGTCHLIKTIEEDNKSNGGDKK